MYGSIPVSLTPQKPPDGHVLGMKLLSDILPMFWNVNKHQCTHCSFNGSMGFRNNMRRPGTAYTH